MNQGGGSSWCETLATSVSGVDMNGLRDLGDQLKEKLGEGVIVLASDCDGKVNLVAMATEEAMGKGAHAGNPHQGNCCEGWRRRRWPSKYGSGRW